MRNFTYGLIDDNATERKIHILEALNNGKTLVSSKDLADQLQCTKRTIINDIAQLKKELPKNWDVISVKTSGYILIKPMTDSILPIINNYLEESVIYKIMLGIFNNKQYTLEKWSQLLFIDKSTLWKYLKNYKSILNENMLRINSRKIQLKGDEFNIRYYYKIFFFVTRKFTNELLVPAYLEKKLYFLVTNNEFYINLNVFRSILFVWMNRFHNKHYITKEIKVKRIYPDSQLKYVNKIITTIEDYYGIKIPKKEKDALSLDLFICSKSTEVRREMIIEYLKKSNHELYESYLILINLLLTENNLSSAQNRKLENKLVGYFYNTIIFNECKIPVSYVFEPLKHADDVIQNNKKNISLVSCWNKKYNKGKFTGEEIATIANSATAILNSVIKEINILLCSSGVTLEDHVIYSKLTKKLGANNKIHTTIDNNIVYDLIISNFEIPDANVPVITFTGMISENEINYIENYIRNLK
ncbi:hypothetical protein IEQ_04958 [Bacillus cereus BAG6X1-2]|nr:hypothetical protein IEQ_04958 [Bacillus cereus BAG6X1-2]